MKSKNGRPPKPGPRYPSGKLKPDNRNEAAYNRLKHAPAGIRELFDPLLGSALGRLSPVFLGELTWTQVDAGKAVGRIYGAYHRQTGARSRSVASPSYQRAFSRSLEDSNADLDARIRQVERRYAELQEIIAALPISTAEQGRARAVIEDLCVDDHQPAAANLPSIRAILSRIAVKLKLKDRGEEPPRRRLRGDNERIAR